jgi:hypothetical protein
LTPANFTPNTTSEDVIINTLELAGGKVTDNPGFMASIIAGPCVVFVMALVCNCILSCAQKAGAAEQVDDGCGFWFPIFLAFVSANLTLFFSKLAVACMYLPHCHRALQP